MKKTKILLLLTVAMLACVSATAQTTRYKSITDSNVVKYMRGGYVKDSILHLMANEKYSALNFNEKQKVLYSIAKSMSPKKIKDITVYTNGQQREIWMASNAGAFLLEEWNNDDLQMENYMPLELKRSGNSKVFYYVGGSYNKGESYSNGILNLRVGTYLYKKTVDISAISGTGYVSMDDSAQFSGNIGIDCRYYLPLNPPKINLSPYVGAGVSWIYAPTKNFELNILTGLCWFLGPGSLDFGIQYGTKSKFTATIGYTFRPLKAKKKHKLLLQGLTQV